MWGVTESPVITTIPWDDGKLLGYEDGSQSSLYTYITTKKA